MRDPAQEADGSLARGPTYSKKVREKVLLKLKFPKPLVRGIRRGRVHMRRLWRRSGVRRHHIHRAGLTGAIVTTAVVFFVIGAAIRLLVGPVSLGPFQDDIAQSLAEALPGVAIQFDEAALEWSRDENRVNVVILGTRMFDADRRIIAQAPKAEVDLAAAPFLRGKMEVKRIALVGMQLTLVRTKEGGLRLGIENDKRQSDILQRIRDAISANKQGASTLSSFAVRHARLAFMDEGTGLFLVSPDANVQISTEDAAAGGAVAAAVDASIEISGRPARLLANFKLPSESRPLTGDISVRGLSVKALGENAKTFGDLKPFDLIADLSASFTVVNGTHLRYADFGIGASGVVNGLGQPLHVRTLRLVARYDGATGRLLIDDATLAGNEASAHLQGAGDLTHDASGALTKAALRLTGDRIAVNMPEELGKKFTQAKLELNADYTPGDGKITLDKLRVEVGPLSAHFSGIVTLADGASPEIAMDGRVEPIGLRDFLNYWPASVVAGPREWIDANIPVGQFGEITLHTDIPAGALDKSGLPDDAVDLRFTLSGATVKYIEGMTPVTGARATARLQGDTFEADVQSGVIGPLTVNNGHVKIAYLHVHATPAIIDAQIHGALPDVLRLIDEPPLRYPTRFGIDPTATKGATDVTLSTQVPTVKDVTFKDVTIAVGANVDGLVVPLGSRIKITGGTAKVDVGNSSLHAVGSVIVAGARLAADWTEDFNTTNPITTKVSVQGRLDDTARDALGFHAGGLLAGPVDVNGALQGHRGSLRTAHMIMDLTPASVGFDLVNYVKPPGVAATATVDAMFDTEGDPKSENIVVTGPQLSVRATAQLSADGDLERLDAPMVHAGPANDFALVLMDTPANYTISVNGRSMDGTAFGRREPERGTTAPTAPSVPVEPAKETNTPFHISAKLDRVVLRQGVTVSPFAVDTSGLGHRPQTFALSGSLSKTATISAGLTQTDAGRRIGFSSNDAGLLLQGLFGFTSIKGGTVDLTANLPPMAQAARNDSATPDYTGAITMKDFRLVDQPFLARLLSAGSLGGLIDLMRGEGVVVDKLQVPYSTEGGVITIRDARASGPAIGMSAEGFIDRGRDQIGLRGVVVPIFGINSVLGAIPLLGDVLVSKKGEGIFGMTYTVSGNSDEPHVTMNPLSVLTPGIFRRIFEGSMPKEDPQASTKPPAPQQKN